MSDGRRLECLRARGRPLALAELARELLALRGPLPAELARRLVAAALGRRADALPDPLPAEELGRRPAAAGDGTPLEAAQFAVVDLETTGLSPASAAILEIAAVRVVGLAVADRFATLVHPGRPVPPRIAALTGIDDRLVAGAPPLREALPRFRAWLEARPDAAFAAHNARFDEGFLRHGLAQLGLPPLGRAVWCTRRLARRIAPELGSFGLDRLAAGLGIEIRTRHRALGDAEATAVALIELLQRARARLGIATLGELRALHDRRPGRGAQPGARPAPA